jgi:aconitate hydratase
MTHPNTFGSRATLNVAGRQYTIFRLASVASLAGSRVDRLPFSLKILLENLLRNEDNAFVKRADVEALARWDVTAKLEKEIAFRTSRVLLQDFTGVPCVVDLAAMRDAMVSLGGDPRASTRCSPSTSSSTTPCKSTSMAAKPPSC